MDILPGLFSEVLIPVAVFEELKNERAPMNVREWIASAPHWLTVKAVSGSLNLIGIDRGEAEAIALAKDLRLLALIDDRRGRAAAFDQGVQVVGTIGLLDRAARQGLLSFESALRDLASTNFHLSSVHLQALLVVPERVLARQRRMT